MNKRYVVTKESNDKTFLKEIISILMMMALFLV